MNTIIEAIAVSLVLSLFFTEIFGLSPAGLVVPGYLAYYLDRPGHLVIIFLATVMTFICERLVSQITVLHGHRLIALDVLLSFTFMYALNAFVMTAGFPFFYTMDAIGYFIPALIVIFVRSHGLLNTCFSLMLLTLLVRSIFILIHIVKVFS